MTPDPLQVAPSIVLDAPLRDRLTYRQRQAAYWIGEAEKCHRDGDADMALKCLNNAATWINSSEPIDWEA